MPEVLETTPQTQETVETPSQQSQQDLNRQALYEQYYGTQTGGDTAVVEQSPITDTTAQVVIETATAAPVTATLPPEVIQLMQSMQAELAALKTQLKPTVPVIDTTHELEPSWIPLLREGRIKEAEDAMAEAMAKKVEARLIEQSSSKTREIMRAENKVDQFVNELRIANPELVPMEKMIAADAQQLMNVAYQAGKVKTTDDAVRIYQESVTEAVSSARKLYHTLRGDGKQEAQVRQREVLSSRPISPQQVDTNRQQTNQQQQEPPAQTDVEYIQRRRAVADYQKGLAPKPNFL